MKGFMIMSFSGRTWLALVLAVAVVGLAGERPLEAAPVSSAGSWSVDRTALHQRALDLWAGADDVVAPDRPATAQRLVAFQELEDPVEPLEPKVKRTPRDEARLNALAAFGRGRILEERADFPGALAAYEKAVEYDPTALPAYKALIGLAHALQKRDLVNKWIAKAADANPAELQFVLQAVRMLLESNDAKGAVRILERALTAPGVAKTSVRYVDISRTLALLYLELDRADDAVASLEVVLDALGNPDKYHLEQAQRNNLRKDLDFEKIGEVLLEASKTEMARVAFQTAAESTKGKARANLPFYLAQVNLQAGKPQEALDELQKYINAETQWKKSLPYELLAKILAKLDKSAELIPRLETAAEKDARNGFLQYFLADQYAAADRLEDAEALYKKTLESSVDVQGFLGLAAVYRRKGRPDDWLSTLARGYSEAGELTEFNSEIKAALADEKLAESLLKTAAAQLQAPLVRVEFATSYLLANLAGTAKKTDLAEKLYRQLLLVKKERADLLYRELGTYFFLNRQFDEAGRVYLEAAEDDDLSDNRTQNLYFASRALSAAGKTKEALAAINTAQGLVPNNPLLQQQEAAVYYYARDFEQAIPKLEKVIADFPQPIPVVRETVREAQHMLSNIYVLKGENRKGEEILEAIFEEDPDDEQVNNDLGYLYADQGKNLEQAERMIRKAVAAKPENGAYLDSLGWVLFKQEKYEEALPWLEKAVKNLQGAGDETLWEHLAENYDRLKQPEKALDAWKKSLELAEKATHPDQKLIERVKARIEKHKKS